MQRLNCTWRQQKAPSTASISKGIDNGPVIKAAPGKRRLGRIAIAVSKASGHQSSDVASSSSKYDKQESFLSSFSVNNDLMEEMDKVEAAMKNNAPSLRKVEKVTTTTVTKPSEKSDLHFDKDLIPNASSARGLVKRQRSQILACKTKDLSQNLKVLKKYDSPSNSPLDKKQRLNRRDAKKSEPIDCEDTVDSLVETNAHSKKRTMHRGHINLKMDDCADISFSPLIATPDITPNPKCHKGKASDITETPKRPKTRKRSSPKYTKSPVVKTVRADRGIIPAQRDTSSSHKSHKTLENEMQGVASSLTETISPVTHALFKKNGSSSDCRPSSDATSNPQRYGQTPDGVQVQLCEVNNKDRSSVEVSEGCLKDRTKFSADRMRFRCDKSKAEEVGKRHPVNRSLNANTSTLDGVSIAVGNVSGNTSLTEDKRMLSSWGLPKPVLDAYESQGVSTMFEWQAECLLSPGVLEGGNLVYSAPTSAGKTLVAELLVLKRVVETRKKALIILPFVSVAREKMFSLKRLYQDAGIKVGGYMGSYSPAGGLSALDVAVCTIEKGNGLVNRLMEDGRIEEIGIVVVDELHMIGDSHRGYLLELMLTKLSYMSCRHASQQCLQIIGMSATLPNLEVLSKWLNAALYRTDFRPVPLSEHLKVDTYIYDDQLSVRGTIPGHLTSPEDTDHIIALCLETILGGHSVLLFCPTKNWCEKLCETIARKFYEVTHSSSGTEKEKLENSSVLFTLNKDGLRESIEQLKRCPVGVDPLLGKCLLNGVAYHHAGLTFDERDIVEGAFRQGSLRVLVATSTLSSGVNLPARRVIIRTPMFHGKVLDTLTYKQMSGRAGRKGVDTEGESILVCKANEKMKGKQLLQSDLPPVKSCLYFEEEDGLSRSLKRAILEVVVSGVASCPSEVMAYINCTLLSASLEITNGNDGISSLMDLCIQFLEDNEFVSMQTITNEDGSEIKKFFPTQLGSAILASSMSPDEGILVFSELQKARRSFVLETDLHVIYLVTPIYASDISASIDWYHFYTLWEGLTPADRRVAELVGVSEAFIARAISGRIYTKTSAQKKSLAVHQRFYTALVLNTLVQEVPLMEVAARFSLNKGQLQSLQQSAATYAGMVTVFSGRLGWHSLEAILSNFQRRLSLGVQHELVDLVRISALNASSARMLYNAGYIGVADVARADPIDVEDLFKKAVPFQSEKKQEGETEWERQERCKARCIWLTGRKGMTEFDAALAIIEEAKLIIEGDVGVKAIVWSSKESGSDDSDDDLSENGEGGSDKENKDVSENVDDSQTSRTKTEPRKSSEATDNISCIGQKTPCNRQSNHFTQLKTRRSRDETPLRPSSSSRRNKSFLKSQNRCHANKGGTNHADLASHDNLTLSGISQREEVAFRKRVSQRSGRVKGQKGDKSILKERSCFGQVVVSPPPGVSLKHLQLLARPSNFDALNAAKDKSRNPLDESKSLSEASLDKEDKEMDCLTSKRNSRRKSCKNNDHLEKKKGNEIDDAKTMDMRDTLKGDMDITGTLKGERSEILGNLSAGKLTSIEDLMHQKKSDHLDQTSPTSREGRANNESLGVSPNMFGDSPWNECSSEVEGKESHDNNCIITKNDDVDCILDGDACNDKYDPEKSISNSVDCSFSGSFVLDTQTVNIINQGVHIDSHEKSPGPGELKRINNGELTMSRESDLSKESEVHAGDNGTSKPRIHVSSDFGTEDPDIRRNEEFERYGKEKHNSPKSGSVSALGTQDQMTPSHHATLEGSITEHNLPSSKLTNQEKRDVTQQFQNTDIDPYTSLVAASDYANAANFDEGMLELSTLIDEEDSKSSHRNNQGDGDVTSDGICGGTFDKIAEFPSPESINQVTDTQRSDDSLLAAVAMPNCYPLSPVVHVNITGANDKNLDTTKNVTGLKCQGKSKKGPNIYSITKQMTTNISKDDPPQDLQNIDDDLFSDSFTASLMDQAFAECAHIRENQPAISKNPGKEENYYHAPLGIMPKHSELASHENLITPERVDSLRSSPPLPNGIESPTSNNSSRNDGSDCVPPTPPDETTLSIRSPAFLRSLKKGGRESAVKSQNKLVAYQKGNPTGHRLDLREESKSSSERVKKSTPSHSIQQKPSDKRTETNYNRKSVSACDHNVNEPCQPDHGDAISITHPGDSDPLSNDLDPVRASQMLTQQSFTIIDVCAHKELFDTFLDEWKSRPNFALSLACEKVTNSSRRRPSVSIGGKFIRKCSPAKCEENPQGLMVPDSSVMVVGLSVSWENRDAYYISLMESHQVEQDADDSLAEPPLCEVLSLQERIGALCQVLNPHSGKGPERINVYDAKIAYTYLAKTLGVSLSMCHDPRVADWLKEQGGRLKNLHRMVITFLPEEIPLLEAIGGVTGYQGLGTDVKSKISGRIRACTESVLTMKLMAEYQKHLEMEQLWDAFLNTEMPSLVTLARMEMNGFGINQEELESQKALMTTKLEKLEQEAYRLAGHPFSLSSTDDIARVLYLELKLPINGDAEYVRKLPARNSRRKCPPVGGTGKEILEKLQKYHVLPSIVLEWRKISSALTKSLFALRNAAKRCDRLQMLRVFGDCQIFSATGRVSLAEPNIQNVPKDFAIQLPEPNLKAGESTDILTTPVSMRKLFIPLKGGMILGADYSQLELRIIAHLSEDKHLIHILNSDSGDVFKLIAAQMKAVDVCEVTPSDRQQAKQVCYGMLYGIGPRALGDQLGMCEEEASVFMEMFKSKYPGVRRYLRETVEFCQKNGFVKTLFNRRRYLPAIKHTNPHARAHAERQAVNTSIQGSAADLVKRAMISIDKRLMEIFPDSQTAHSQASSNSLQCSKQMPDRNKASKERLPTGAFFVLQLHDELLYEVSSGHVDTVARLVKHEMEKAVKLLVKLPVKVKVGRNWSQLEDYDISSG